MNFTLKDFKFSDQDIKKDFVRNEQIYKKINIAIDYLLKYTPINKLNSDNTFDFDKLEFDEGKNYDWYFINNDKIIILVRQYSTHFTFFVKRLAEYSYFDKISVFTIHDNMDKMSDDLNDKFCDDNFIGIKNYLPKLVSALLDDKAHLLWNDRYFTVENYTDVKIAMDGKEYVTSLDVLTYACDELFNQYLCAYGENDVIDVIKKIKVGDFYDGVYEVVKVESNHTEKDELYYNGLKLKNTNFEDSEATWCDIYTLVRYYYNGLDVNKAVKSKIKKFIIKNHNLAIDYLMQFNGEDFSYLQIESRYNNFMFDLFTKDIETVDKKVFNSALDNEHYNLVKLSLSVKIANLTCENQ